MTGGIGGFFLDLLFPKYCLDCGREGDYLCENCRREPFKNWDGQIQIDSPCFIDEIGCFGDYEDERLGGLIKACKYRFVKEIAPLLGDFLAEELKSIPKYEEGAIVSVPLSRRRERWRGFNQAQMIAEAVAQRLGLPYIDCLSRIKHTKPQAKLQESDRLANMQDCFSVKGQSPPSVIIIDDVITTGTTMNECARVLKEAGAKRVIAAAVAKG